MSRNLYEPPRSEVRDGSAEAIPHRSTICTIVAAIVGAFSVAIGFFAGIAEITSKGSLALSLAAFTYGLFALAAARGIYHQMRWVAITWSIICGLPLLLPLPLADSEKSTVTLVAIALLFLQLILVLLALVVILRKCRGAKFPVPV